MRTQTTLARILEGAHEESLGIALVAFRVTFGIFLFASLSKAVHDFAPMLANGPVTVVAIVLRVFGVLLLVGLGTRIVGILGTLCVILSFAFAPQGLAHALPVNIYLLLCSAFLIFAAGGLGGAFGLNGILLRHMRAPRPWVRFLFS